MNRGVLYALVAYVMWGLFPIYWKWLHAVPALEILSHRMAWSMVFVFLLLIWKKKNIWPALRQQPRRMSVFLLTASLLSVNWGLYIWAVNSQRVVDASLGYFINPLVNVVLGVFIFKEHLRPGHWLAVGLAAAGVLYLALQQAGLPWIALVLAVSFSLYGLLRKMAPLNSLEGLAVETALLLPFALLFLISLELNGAGAFAHAAPPATLLLALAGPVTALPLLFFAAGARRIPFSQIGFLQYIAPTLQFLIGVLLFHEPLSATRLAGFSLVWLALLIYGSVEWGRSRRVVIEAPLE